MKKEMICISCPIGCRLTAEWTDENDITITGNRCNRGKIYGQEEVLAPKRVVTSTVKIAQAPLQRVPVKTDAPLLKEHIDGLLQELYSMELSAPVSCGDVVLQDIGGTGVNLVITRSLPQVKAG